MNMDSLEQSKMLVEQNIMENKKYSANPLLKSQAPLSKSAHSSTNIHKRTKSQGSSLI